MAVLLSVVVPTYKRPASLQRCLQALLSQDLDNSLYEVIIVDGSPSWQTNEVISSFIRQEVPLPASQELSGNGMDEMNQEPGPVNILHTEPEPATWDIPGFPRLRYIPMVNKRGPAAARNIGWEQAEGRIIAFTDDDCVPWPSWLSVGLKGINAGSCGVSGQVIVPLPKKPTDMDLVAAEIETCEFSSANSFYTRESLANVGGFDERFKLAWQEDRDLYLRLVKSKARLSYIPTAIVIHPANKPWWSFFTQARKSMYNALLFKKHQATKLDRVFQDSPLHHYLILVLLAAGLAGLYYSQSLLGYGSLSLWGLAIMRIAWLRMKDTSVSVMRIGIILITSLLISPLHVFWRLVGAVKFWVFFL